MNDLTIVLPTLNEAGNIGPLIQSLQAAIGQTPVIVVDASSDDTPQQAQQAGARVIDNRKGYAASLLQGLREAATKWVLVMDADGSHTAEDALKLWQAREEADLVVGSRLVKGGGSAGGPFRRFLSRTLAGLFATFARMPARDVSSGFRLYRRELFLDAPETARFFEVQPTLLAHAKRKGARVKEIGIYYHPRGKGRSKNRIIRYGLAFLGALWRLRR
ncbi:MAG: glycosyltransferase [Planctomycetes bacterium]|nr:glycosyltransferase [Planctomycetota bacterium]MCB9935041.1 glycosyltransferase [Planctomycetota bacterium]